MTLELESNVDYNPEIHGDPFGAKLVIGFTNVYYTLWRVTFFSKVEHVHYLQNLSMDFGKAQAKVSELLESKNGSYFGHDFEVDLDLRGTDGWSFFRPLAAKRYAPELLAFSRFVGRNMRDIDPNEEYFSHYAEAYDDYGHKRRGAVEPVYKKMSGLLWATYLNKEENTFRGLRRRVIARQCLVNAGLLILVDGRYITPEQAKKAEDKRIREAAINGHHEEDGKRISLKVKRLGKPFSFDTQFGTTYIITLIDENNRLFKYMGSKLLDIEDEFVEVKATIKFDNYKDQAETKLQRIKIA